MFGHRRRIRARFAALAAAAAGLSCGGGDELPNEPPVAVGSIPPIVLLKGQVITMRVAAFFGDPDDDELAYSAVSSNPALATVSMEAATLAVTGVAAGNPTVTVTATDPEGESATQDMAVTVENRAPQVADTLPVHDLFIVAGDTGPDPDTLSEVLLDVSGLFRDPDGDALAYTASTEHDSVAEVESVEGSVIATIPVGVADGSLWDSTRITVTATDPDGGSVGQVALVRVAPSDYEPWYVLEITEEGGLLLVGNNQPISGCVAIDGRTFGDTVYTVHRSEWQVRKGTGWVRVLTTYRELAICSWEGLPTAPAGTYRLAGEVTTWPADTSDGGPGDTVRALRSSENVIEVTNGNVLPKAPSPPDRGSGEPARPAAFPARKARRSRRFHRSFRYRSARLTNPAEPRNSGVRSCSPSGTISRMSRLPSDALPPAASHTNARGAASYRIRSLPAGAFVSRGYMKSPPWSRVRCTSETMEPM